jgi:hypothetical protein
MIEIASSVCFVVERVKKEGPAISFAAALYFKIESIRFPHPV